MSGMSSRNRVQSVPVTVDAGNAPTRAHAAASCVRIVFPSIRHLSIGISLTRDPSSQKTWHLIVKRLSAVFTTQKKNRLPNNGRYQKQSHSNRHTTGSHRISRTSSLPETICPSNQGTRILYSASENGNQFSAYWPYTRRFFFFFSFCTTFEQPERSESRRASNCVRQLHLVPSLAMAPAAHRSLLLMGRPRQRRQARLVCRGCI